MSLNNFWKWTRVACYFAASSLKLRIQCQRVYYMQQDLKFALVFLANLAPIRTKLVSKFWSLICYGCGGAGLVVYILDHPSGKKSEASLGSKISHIPNVKIQLNFILLLKVLTIWNIKIKEIQNFLEFVRLNNDLKWSRRKNRSHMALNSGRSKGAIKAIFFSEFHPTLGPKISYQVWNSIEICQKCLINLIHKPTGSRRLCF